MKYLIFAVCATLALCSCKKSAVIKSLTSEQGGGLVGKWSLVNDASSLAGTAIFPGRSRNYIGTAADYFNFTTDGNLYIKEGSDFDTATYTVSGDTAHIIFYYVDGVSFPDGGSRGPFVIKNLTSQTVTLQLGPAITPEGEESEEIDLKT